MTPTARKVAPLLFGSGLCALIYQIAWMRELRLIFGASTAASAAVLAIFIGGLGVGGVVLGGRADKRRDPLFFYAQLEALVSVSAALTPLLLWLARKAYLGVGGTVTLGLAGGTVARLLLSALVLAAPTIVMGGTLPAASRAVESDGDAGRRSVALLYGVNTFGAVTGCVAANFALLEIFGTRITLWMACLVNLLIAVMAVRVDRDLDIDREEAAAAARASGKEPEAADAESEAGEQVRAGGSVGNQPLAPAAFVLASAAVVGFAFFLMELVWYRMLGPLLGGTVFTFGLILALALFGIGLGGAFYAAFGRGREPSLLSFAWTCLLEALFVALPFALGDRLAVLALSLRPLGHLGFFGHVFGWSLTAGLVVVPAAFASGVQFPMLIALLGRGRRDVGRQVGLTYAWNTVGAIAGSLGGGFGLLPALSAPGCWRAVAAVLALLGLSAIVLSLRAERRVLASLAPAAVLLASVALLFARGPTAFWRHSGIGAGRVDQVPLRGGNTLRAVEASFRAGIAWEQDGVESSVALRDGDSISFVVNGKVDGNAVSDAPTQIGLGVVGGVLHPRPRSGLVIGLGTGSTAGWLGAVPSVERVDVVELEPAVLRVARDCSAVNRKAMENPKVHVQIGDAREILLATPMRYDLVLSEPSNPYRAGVASLFTREFYRAAEARLAEGGMFLQWVQGYEIDGQTLRTIYATLASVFPSVETWELASNGDLLLVASRGERAVDLGALRERLSAEPFRDAFVQGWRVADLEGFLAHFLAGPQLAQAIARDEGELLNTDDLCPVEFGFARSVSRSERVLSASIRDLARARGEHRPKIASGEVDWARVEDERLATEATYDGRVTVSPGASREQIARAQAISASGEGSHAQAVAAWKQLPRPPSGINEVAFFAHSLAETGDEAAVVWAEKLRPFVAPEADAILARLQAKQGKSAEAAASLERVFSGLRGDPWTQIKLIALSLRTAEELSRSDPAIARRMFAALAQPFAARVMNLERELTRFRVAPRTRDPNACVEALRPLEPWVPWNEAFLAARYACYQAVNHPLSSLASDELVAFTLAEPRSFDSGLAPSAPPPPPLLPPSLPARPEGAAPPRPAASSLLPPPGALP